MSGSYQQVYEKKILKFEQQYGSNQLSDMIRFTHSRIANTEAMEASNNEELKKLYSLFDASTVEEFKKVWKKLKEIEARVPGPVVTPVPQPVPPPPPAPEPVPPAPSPAADPKPPKASSKK